MSTKNLARTVIEGGRAYVCGFLRKEANANERSSVRQRLGQTTMSGDWDAVVLGRKERGGLRCFRDKLGPAKRWLYSQVGRPWDLVRSELFARFDTRTTAGRHVLFCHMLDWVEHEQRIGRSRDFRIDTRGVLRRVEHGLRPGGRRNVALPRPRSEVMAWLAGRRVGERGVVLFWFIGTDYGAFRQGPRLTAEEAVYWRTLPVCFRESHGPAAPRDDDETARRN